MAKAVRKTIDLLRLVDLLQQHITPAVYQAAFGRVRINRTAATVVPISVIVITQIGRS